MNRLSVVIAVVLLAACGGASPTTPVKPAGIDPSVLVVSQTPDSVWVTWASDSGLVTIVVPPWTTSCTKWTQVFDSLYIYVRDSVPGDTTHMGSSPPGAPRSTVLSPWVHLAEYPNYFQVDTVYSPGYPRSNTGSWMIANHLATAEC